MNSPPPPRHFRRKSCLHIVRDPAAWRWHLALPLLMLLLFGYALTLGCGPHPHLCLRSGPDAREPRADRPVSRFALFSDSRGDRR